MDWLQPMDEYCERIDASFWSEPLNAISNAAFIVAALVLFIHWSRSKPHDVIGLLLTLNVFIVGAGSFLYHTFANGWSVMADVIPITVFILFYLVVALRSYLRLRWWMSLAALIAFFAASHVVSNALEPVIGYTAAYLPALAAITAVAIAARNRAPEASHGLWMAGSAFALSCLFRAADLPFCAENPAGTPMVWHLLTGLTLYLLVRTYMLPLRTPG